MKLFDVIQNENCNLVSYSIPAFEFLNQSDRNEVVDARNLLEQWFDHYPNNGKSEFRRRFRSKNNHQHKAAFFELFLHELLLRLGCKLSLHQPQTTTSRVPDFFAESQRGEKFFIEATSVTCESANEEAARSRENSVYDVLDRLVISPDYFLSLTVRDSPDSAPPARKIALLINDKLKNLEYENIVKLYNNGEWEKLPDWSFNHDGWNLIIRPIPKIKGRGGRGIRPIGSIMTSFRLDHTWKNIRDAVIQKGKRYGKLDYPFIIALDVWGPVDVDDILQALYGQELTQFYSSDISEEETTRIVRQQNGAWLGPNGKQNSRISGVFVVTHLSPYNMQHIDMRLYHNPWAQKPYKSVLNQLNQAIPVAGKIQYIDGKNTKDIFNLSSNYLE